ncbi:MAG: recombination regulator RecX [Oscillospiraceae bacterium]|nr:recombination regulator RecX [Oscillospiraceae bacterium]
MFENDENPALEKCKRRSLKILGNRQMSSAEMGKRLLQKGESEDNAQKTVMWLERIGAINDTDFAEAICLHYFKKGYGLSRIKDELYRRGIERELWDAALATIETEEPNDAAVDFIKKKLRGSTDKDDIRRATDALCRRGFGYEEARQAVARYIEEYSE